MSQTAQHHEKQYCTAVLRTFGEASAGAEPTGVMISAASACGPQRSDNACGQLRGRRAALGAGALGALTGSAEALAGTTRAFRTLRKGPRGIAKDLKTERH